MYVYSIMRLQLSGAPVKSVKIILNIFEVNSNQGANYAHHITACPPEFENLANGISAHQIFTMAK